MKHSMLKKGLAVVTALGLVLCAGDLSVIRPLAAEENVLAFPGATGAGRYATGGRGGEVVHVTNLNDSGEGSFREAVGTSNRIVVFDVSGTIELSSNILVADNVTIAGQTAPGGSGITLKNYKMGMSGDNIICRFVSSRPGPYKATSSGNDAWGGAKGSNSIIDHCSMSWTTDEQWGLYSNNEYYTVQYSIIGPADSWGGHSKGVHGFGLMMGKGYSTFDHNLIIHNVSRNFRGKVVGTETADFTNNVIYNWAYQTAYGTIGHLNYVGNTLKMGNGTTGGHRYVSVDSSTNPENFSIYLTGNRMLNIDDSVYASITDDNWEGISFKSGLGKDESNTRSDTAFETIVNGENVSTALTAESAEDAYEHVLSFAGNGISPTLRTAVDQQAAYEAQTGTGNLSGTASYDDATGSNKEKIDNYKITCGVTYEYPDAVLEKTITDADNDGMDDDWELARGLDPNDPSDATGDYCGQGYNNIEYYANDLTVDAFPEGVVTLSPETEPVVTRSAYETIEAESYDSESGTATEDCNEGGQNVGYIENGDYLCFENVDFGTDGAKSFSARVSGGSDGCAIEVYLDSLDTTPVATCAVPGTEDWQTWESVSCNLSGAAANVHDIYLKFVGAESGYLFNLNHFTFSTDTVPLNGVLIQNLNVSDTEHIASWNIAQNIAVGSQIYGDRDFTIASLPESLAGAEYIQTACDSKNYTEFLATFTAGGDITVSVALDTRVTTAPAWLDTWTSTADTILASNDVVFAVYQKTFAARDKIELGENGQSSGCVGYFVLAQEQKGEPTPSIAGDMDGNAILNGFDLTQMRTLLLGQTDVSQVSQADFNGDGAFSLADAVALQRYLNGVTTA